MAPVQANPAKFFSYTKYMFQLKVPSVHAQSAMIHTRYFSQNHARVIISSIIYLFIYLLNFNYTDLNIIYTLEDKLTIKINKKKKCKNHKIQYSSFSISIVNCT